MLNRAWLIDMGLCLVLWSASAMAETGRGEMRGTTEGSTVTGTVWIVSALGSTPTSPMVRVEVSVSGTSPGPHGIHIHEFGDCGDGGKAAGGHYNPDHVSHGLLAQDGLAKAHPGDLGNIEVGPDGTGSLVVVLRGIDVSNGQYNLAGRAVILHDQADDFGQPTGNAGGRIGCAPILITSTAAHPDAYQGAPAP